MAQRERQAHELLLIEEADAWFEYLEATRGQRTAGEAEAGGCLTWPVGREPLRASK